MKLVVADAHEGLKAAVRKVIGAGWQRGRVHFMRNVLQRVPKRTQAMVTAAPRTAFDRVDE